MHVRMIKKAMMNFIFQTGHGKGLARKEIESLLDAQFVDEVMDGFVVQAEIANPNDLLRRMGGIVRITEVLESGPARMPLNFTDWIVKSAKKHFANMSGKLRYGLSMHPKSEKILKKTLIDSKKMLQKELGNLRFVNKDFQNLSSVQAWHERLLDQNAVELHLFKSEERWYLCKTLAIQDFEAYSVRDMDRPAKSAKNGMFPPKLAQVLINLAIEKKSPEETTVWDPFCGSGTVLQEALLMDCPVVGSDLSKKMVDDSQKNLDWLIPMWRIENPKIQLFEADATQLKADQVPGGSFVIVTESYLGPLLLEPPKNQEKIKIQHELEQLYEDFFSNLKKILKKPVTLVFTAAYLKEGNERSFLPKLPGILAKYSKIIPLSEHERPSLFYERKGQIIGREIWKLEISPD